MPYDYSQGAETPEERALRQRQAVFKRVRILGGVLVISIVARVFIKPPPPPKSPDVSSLNIRVVPGALDRIPADTLAKMNPKIVAQIREVEKKQLEDKYLTSHTGGPAYQPSDVPLTNLAEEEALKQLQYTYAKKRKSVLREQKEIEVDVRKKMLILFRGGGFMKAERAAILFKSCQIQVDNTFQATLPSHFVKSVSENALTWKEPVPKGFVQLKPARGITITVAQETAKRISIPNAGNES